MSKHFGGIFDFEVKSRRLTEVNSILEDPTIWDDQKKAQALGKEKKLLDGVVATLTDLNSNITGALELFDMAKEESDFETIGAIEQDVESYSKIIHDLEFRRMFHNEMDSCNCFIDIQAGAGGTEACDWASMLFRQYLKYCERKGYKTEILEESDGDVAGIKSATIKVDGRHTSFASIYVYPEIDDSIEIDVNPADIRTDTYRASGAGGQHINKTDSAVRLTHLPTGIVVQCQNDRSQHRNRAEAMTMLKSRLYEHEMQKRRAEQDKLEASKTDVGWGHQIRSYVLDQSRIKDLRTNVEISNTQKVLDGDLDAFIEASLKQGV